MLRGLGPIPNLDPMSPNSGLFPYNLAEAVPVQVSNIVDYGSKSFLSFQLLSAQSFVSFTMHVLHGFFFPSNTPTNMKLSQSDSDDSAILLGFGHDDSAMMIRPCHSDESAILLGLGPDDSAMPIGRFGHTTRTRPR